MRSTVFASVCVGLAVLTSCGGSGGRKDSTPVVRTERAGDPVESYGDSSERPAPVKSHLLPLRSSPAVRRAPAARVAGPFEAELALCVSETNALRSSAGLPALKRSAELEACAAAAAAEDHRSGNPHGHFQRTSGCELALAENELPRWLLPSQAGALAGVIRSGLAMMWDEGPGGGHHDNIVGAKYTDIGCGIFISGDSVTVVQNFR